MSPLEGVKYSLAPFDLPRDSVNREHYEHATRTPLCQKVRQ